MRLNEILNLQIKDIDFLHRLILIRNKKDIRFSTKTSSERSMPINDVLFDYLKEWIGQLNNPESFLINFNGKRYSKNTISRKFVLALRKINIKGSMHSYRHSFCSELLAKGVDVNTVRELAGHSGLAVTLVYLHSNNELKIKAVNKLN